MKRIIRLLFSVLVMLVLVGGVVRTASAGTYYMYADFTSADGFNGGYDVDSYDDYLYVNRNGTTIDRYTVSTATTATTDVNTHPDNIGPDETLGTADDNMGPMATRTLAFDFSYNVPAIGGASVSEIYATSTGLFFLDNASDVSYYDFGSGATSLITAASTVNLSQLARSAGGTWFASNERNDIYEYDGAAWNKIIDHVLTPGGGHLDGLETAFLDVTDDGIDNAVEWLFAADMTSDYMKRYSLDGVYQETYSYNDTHGLYLEGMGFGANNHFWATSGSHLYEIGGGAFTGVTDDGGDDDDNPPIPEPSTILLLGVGLIGLAIGRKKMQK